MTRKSYSATGKQVFDPAGEHFADAVSPVAALLIVAALQWRKHHPVIEGDEVICSRCRNGLPHDGHEPCIPRTPRCSETPDMFGEPRPQPVEKGEAWKCLSPKQRAYR